MSLRFAIAVALLLSGACFALSLPARAQDAPSPVLLLRAAHQDVSPPLSSLARHSSLRTSHTLTSPLGGIFTGFSFDGQSSTGWAAPDPNGAVGATQYVQWVNVSYAVYDKTSGNLTLGPFTGNTLWSGFGGPCESLNNGDPIVLYDKLAARWVFTQRTTPNNGPYYQCFAVSATSDATGAYHRYSFLLPNYYPDYPKLGVWPDAYYLTVNELTPSNFAFHQSLVCAMDRLSMIAGQPATAQCLALNPLKAQQSLLPADVDGLAPPPSGDAEYLINLGSSQLNVWRFKVNFSDASKSRLSGPTPISVPRWTNACNGGACVPQGGSAQVLDGVGDRLMFRLAYRNFGDHESFVLNHSVNSNGAVGIRWYELRNPSGKLELYQSATLAPDANSRWMASAAMDKQGNIALGYSISGHQMNPSINVTGRLASDPLGTLDAETVVTAGAGSETGSDRWGDYSSLTVDPSDDCTFWYTAEYFPANGNRNWIARIASFRFPACAP